MVIRENETESALSSMQKGTEKSHQVDDLSLEDVLALEAT